MALVTVIIPNYNHGKFLQKRIETVLGQSFKDFEVIIMDDTSTDNSVDIINQYSSNPHVKNILINNTNSGNTFLQWEKGIKAATGKYIWIAESDDYAESTFLEKLVPVLESNNNIGIAYSQSWKVDKDGNIQNSLLQHTAGLSTQHWEKSYLAPGQKEVEEYLLFINSIPNASAVLFKKSIYEKAGGIEPEIKKCSDWLLWMKMLLHSDVYFYAEHLNYFRFHPNSVIASTEQSRDYFDSKMRKSFQHYLELCEPADEIKLIKKKNKALLRRDTYQLSKWLVKKKLKSLVGS